MVSHASTFFAPQLFIPSGCTNVDFYINGLGATELRRFSNPDGSIHVSELSLNGAIFHLHEQKNDAGLFQPDNVGGTTVLIGLFVDNVDALINRAVAAGATLRNPAQDYDYGYRQGEFQDPHGQIWLIQKAI